ncbi:MAG: hypothetical protein ABI808_02450 [Pseudonocardiales bacterium]
MPHVRRLPVAGAAAVTVSILLTGCVSVVTGDGAAVTGQHTSTTGATTAMASPTGLPSTTTSTGPTATTTAASPTASAAPASDLTSLLAPAPSGSRPWGTPWSKNGTPTLEEFVAHVYPARALALAKSQLKAQGIKDIAHRTWIATDANQADTILLRFDTAAGAVSRYRSATAAKGGDTGQRHFDVPGYPQAIGYYNPTLDELGNVRTIVYGQIGTIVVEVFFYSPAKLDKAAAITAITNQLQRLPS